MPETEYALRTTALKALRAKKINHYVDPSDNLFVNIVPSQEDLVPLKLPMPEKLGNKTIRLLWRAYDIPIHWFWNPSMIPGPR